MDDDDIVKLVVRGWSLLCASILNSGGGSTTDTIKKAERLEQHMLKDVDLGDG